MSAQEAPKFRCEVHDVEFDDLGDLQQHNEDTDHVHTLAGGCSQCGKQTQRTFRGRMTRRTPLLCPDCKRALVDELAADDDAGGTTE